jgi:hypothetical protein
MSEQITWTHVDKLVRKMLDDRGQLACGGNDAEVALVFIKFLGRSLNQAEISVDSRGATIASLQRQLKEAQAVRPGKTKKRIDALEKAVRELQNKQAVSYKQCAAANGHNACHRNALLGSDCCAEHQR